MVAAGWATSWADYWVGVAANSRSVATQEIRQRSLASAVSRAVQSVTPPSPNSAGSADHTRSSAGRDRSGPLIV